MKRITLVLALMIAVAGCAAPGHLNTPSGHPEVTVHASLQGAQNESMHWLLANGFTVGNQDLTKQIIFIAGFQSMDGGATNLRISFNYYQKDSTTTTIYAAKDYYYRYRTGGNPQTSQSDYEELQQDLNAIAQNLTQSK
jgi:hypothetical protein